MSLDTTKDDLIEGLRSIGKTQVTAALATAFGDVPAVRETRGFPVPLDLVENTALPLLAVWIEREQEVQTTMRRVDQRLTVAFEYFAPATPLAKLGLRWPILRRVWRELLLAVGAGVIGVGALAVNVLSGLGVVAVDVERAVVDYDFASDGEKAFPHFLGRIVVTVRPAAIVLATLQDLRELFVKIDDPGGVPGLQPVVSLFARTEAGVLAVEGSGDPFDPDSEDA